MAWDLGPLIRDGYGIAHQMPLQRTNMQHGPQRVIRYANSYLTRVSGSVYLPDSTAQATWKTFREGEMNLGQAWFDMAIVTDGAQSTHSVRVVSIGQQVPRGMGWLLPMTVETRDHLT